MTLIDGPSKTTKINMTKMLLVTMMETNSAHGHDDGVTILIVTLLWRLWWMVGSPGLRPLRSRLNAFLASWDVYRASIVLQQENTWDASAFWDVPRKRGHDSTADSIAVLPRMGFGQPQSNRMNGEVKARCKIARSVTFSRERLRRVLRKKAAVILHLHTFTSADLHLHTFTSADIHLHTFTPADLDLHTFTPADLDLHTLTSADLDLHTFTSADLDLHTLTSADLDLHTLTPADLDLHTLTPADLDLHILTPADLDLHTLTSADLHHHTLTPADLDLHTLTPADLDLHTFTSADLDLRTFTSADLLSLFFYSLLRRGRCRRSATKRNPFARNGRWTSKT